MADQRTEFRDTTLQVFSARNLANEVLVSGDVALLLNPAHGHTAIERARRRGIEPAQLGELRLRAQRFMDALAVALGQPTQMLGTHFPARWPDSRDFDFASEPIDPRRFDVAAIPDDTTAKRFVLEHHYSGSFPAARFRFGLYEGAEIVGVAVFSVPAHPRVITNCLPGGAGDSVELGRFVLLDSVPGNGETWFLGRCFAALRDEGLVGVVSFSDPMPRSTVEGATVFGGHIGTIYQAHNAVYLGRGVPRTLRLLPDGSVLSARALSKLRAGDRGERYAAQLLERHGASARAPDEERRAWTARWVDRLTRRVRHPGNHKYVWALDRRARKHLPAPRPYPKVCA